MQEANTFYDTLAPLFDVMTDWDARLALEKPFLLSILEQVGARRVLDAACGSGGHALALARHGYQVAGADVSPGMIALARQKAVTAGLQVPFAVADLAHLSATELSSLAPYDAILCLGNSLPHILTPQALRAALADFAGCLQPGGVLLIQNLNYDRILARRERWMEPQGRREKGQEWLFLRFYDFDPDGLLTFNMVLLQRGEGAWEQRVICTRLWPQRQVELVAALEEAGFAPITLYGDMQGTPFDPRESPNLVIVTWLAGRPIS